MRLVYHTERVSFLDRAAGEIVPADPALVGEVIVASGPDGNKVKQRFRQVLRERWGAHLVVDDRQKLPFLGELDHRVGEILSTLAVEPGRPHDQKFAAALFYFQLAFPFRHGVNALGRRRVVLFHWMAAIAEENEIGADGNERDASLFAFVGKISRPFGVQPSGECFILLGLVDRGVGRAVQDQMRLGDVANLLYLSLVENVHLPDVRQEEFVFPGQFFPHRFCQHSVGA